jgi:ParB family chromosome partitioning protein
MEIPVDQITPNPHQPRRQFNEQALAELAASIKSTGLIQPIVVRAAGTGYEIIAGERRWRAARIAGLTSIPALVRAVDRFTQAQIALVENIQREDLNPMDRARAYQDVIALVGLTQGELAGRLGVERSGIANHLRLLMLPRPVQAMVADGSLSVGHAKVLAGVSDQVEQERYAQLVLSQGLSVRNLERAIESDNPASAPAAASAATSAHPATGSAAHLPDLEQALTRQLGLRVQVRAGKVKGRGRLILHYATLDEFDGLMTRMGVRIED